MSRRILVADDSSTIQKVIKIAFARHSVEIVEASSFIEALAAVVRQGPDLLIVDASLPGAKGPEDFAKLARDAQSAPVLLLFGTYDAVDEVLFRQAGFPHFLKKPFESGELLALADRLLGGELNANASGRDAPVMPPPPDQPRAAGRQAHTAVIYGPGTFQLDERQDLSAPPPVPSRPAPPRPPLPGSAIPDLDLGAAAPAPDDSPSPRVLTDQAQRGRRAFVPEPPVGTLAPRASRGAPVPPPPPQRGEEGDDPDDLEAELQRMGVPPPAPLAARTPPPTPAGARPMPRLPADLGRAPDTDQVDALRGPGRRPDSDPTADNGRTPSRRPDSDPTADNGRTPSRRPDFDPAGNFSRGPARKAEASAEDTFASRGRTSGLDDAVPDLSRSPDYTRTDPGTLAPANPPHVRPATLGDEELLALLDERLPQLARQAIEDYCERHFKSLAREIIATELRRLADEKARHLVDN